MNKAQNQESGQIRDRTQFHLIDLVPRNYGDTERVDIESNLQRLEWSLNSWLLAKIEETKANQIAAPVAGTNAEILSAFCRNDAVRTRSYSLLAAGDDLISTDDRDILKVLQAELDFIEQGGYGRSVKTPWQSQSPFEDSLTCINYAYLEKAHPCSECHLIDFVPIELRTEKVPCHFIPLNESGETIDKLESDDNQQKLEEALRAWLHTRIKELEEIRPATQ
jgi:hypothetical protein